MTTPPPPEPSPGLSPDPHSVVRPWHRPAARFVLHYLAMLLAMLVGMLLFPLWTLLVGSLPEVAVLHRVEADSLAMAAVMSVPMVALMRWHGHRTALSVEMVLAMVAGFVVLFPPLWAGLIGEADVFWVGHVLMPLFMLAAMLLRRREYLGAHHGAATMMPLRRSGPEEPVPWES